jgi:hypothetical protein
MADRRQRARERAGAGDALRDPVPSPGPHTRKSRLPPDHDASMDSSVTEVRGLSFGAHIIRTGSYVDLASKSLWGSTSTPHQRSRWKENVLIIFFLFFVFFAVLGF